MDAKEGPQEAVTPYENNDPAKDGPQAQIEKCVEFKDDIQDFGENLTADTIKNRDLYDRIATNYDFVQEITGFNDPQMVSQYILQNKDKYPTDIRIADFGCGTGFLGEDLAEAGYMNIAGIDASLPMLKLAQERKTKDGSRTCYQECYQNMVGSDPIPNDLAEKMKEAG